MQSEESATPSSVIVSLRPLALLRWANVHLNRTVATGSWLDGSEDGRPQAADEWAYCMERSRCTLVPVPPKPSLNP